ncbi:MAG TPA: S8 family serine peptidase [Candidatus Paceibacterota bacterium]|nr:S8 family serine peptidase [Verrucomicrobiota bacterium]HRZ47496.1 S8 family serine peptidase [Candidatus Paceibacterota bacterium]
MSTGGDQVRQPAGPDEQKAKLRALLARPEFADAGQPFDPGHGELSGESLRLAFRLAESGGSMAGLRAFVDANPSHLFIREAQAAEGAVLALGELRIFPHLGLGAACLSLDIWARLLDQGLIDKVWFEPRLVPPAPASAGPAPECFRIPPAPGIQLLDIGQPKDRAPAHESGADWVPMAMPDSGPFRRHWDRLAAGQIDEPREWLELWALAQEWCLGKAWLRLLVVDEAVRLLEDGPLSGRLRRPFRHLPIVEISLPPLGDVLRYVQTRLNATTVLAASRFRFWRPLPPPQPAKSMAAPAFFGLDTLTSRPLGEGVRLGMLDTGLDIDHPALRHLDPEHLRDFSGDGNSRDWDGHGTHCASVALGRGEADIGVAPGAELVFAKVFGQDGNSSMESLLLALDWMAAEGVDVLSLSIGEAESSDGGGLLRIACECLAQQHGILIVAAAGNSGPSLETVGAPADAPAVLAVGACDARRRLARFSSRGSSNPRHPLFGKPDLVGPGVGVLGAKALLGRYPSSDGSGLFTAISGTSMATPAIAGLSAVLYGICLEKDRKARRDLVLETMRRSCVPLNREDGMPHRRAWETGAGVPDAAAAIKALGSGGKGRFGRRDVPSRTCMDDAPRGVGAEAFAGASTQPERAIGLQVCAAQGEPHRACLRHVEDEIFGCWKSRLQEHLASLAPQLFHVAPGLLGTPEIELNSSETDRLSELRDLEAVQRWPEGLLDSIPLGRRLTVKGLCGKKVAGGLLFCFLMDPAAMASGKIVTPFSTVIAARNQQLERDGGVWHYAFAGFFSGPRPGGLSHTVLVSCDPHTMRWSYEGNPETPALDLLCRPESDVECARRVSDYLASTGKDLVLGADVASATGLTEIHVEVLSPSLNGWQAGRTGGHFYLARKK